MGNIGLFNFKKVKDEELEQLKKVYLEEDNGIILIPNQLEITIEGRKTTRKLKGLDDGKNRR